MTWAHDISVHMVCPVVRSVDMVWELNIAAVIAQHASMGLSTMRIG
jgi:hypothetical protein